MNPIENLFNVAGKNVEFIAVSDCGLQKNTDGIRQLIYKATYVRLDPFFIYYISKDIFANIKVS